MAYIGRDLNRGNYLKLDNIQSQFNGSTRTFSLTVGGQAFYPGSPYALLLSLGGVVQEPNSAFELNGSQVTFATAPTSGSAFFGIVLGISLGVGVPADGTVTGTKLSSPFNYNSGLLYLDTTNNRVGILSTSPTVALDVIGNSRVSGITNLNGLSVSGISTLGTVKISSGIVTASSGIVTYYGNGSNLTGIVTTKNLTVGTRTTAVSISVVGTGMTVSLRSGIGTVNF